LPRLLLRERDLDDELEVTNDECPITYDGEGKEGHGPKIIIRSLWTHICDHFYPAEFDEVRATLGSQLVDENEALQLEVIALSEMLGDLQKMTDETQGSCNRRRLPKSPVNKMLERQIAFFVQNLRSKPNKTGLLDTPRDHSIVEDIVSKGRSHSSGRSEFQPMTPRADSPTASSCCFDFATSRCDTAQGTADTVEVQLRPGSACARRTISAQQDNHQKDSGADLLSPMQESINFRDIEAVSEALRGAMREETASFLEQIGVLQACLEEENDTYLHVANMNAPSLDELRSVNAKLERAWLEQDMATGAQNPLHSPHSQHHLRPRPSSPAALLPLKR
jgi:hypothetical protein